MFRTEFLVEFGDCDEAGVVYYPKYFYWFDTAFQHLLRSKGLSQRTFRRKYGAVTPITEAGARFQKPVSYDDVLTVQASVAHWEERRFKVEYALAVDGKTTADGYEIRAWAAPDANGRLRGVAIDAEFRELFIG